MWTRADPLTDSRHRAIGSDLYLPEHTRPEEGLGQLLGLGQLVTCPVATTSPGDSGARRPFSMLNPSARTFFT